MKLFLTLVLAATFLAGASPAASDDNSIASVTCSPKKSLFAVKYRPDNDDFFSQTNLSARCRIGSAIYTVKGMRGEFSESGQCGGQPPVSIELKRDGVTLVTDSVFGDNCFGGPAISEVQFRETNGNLHSFTLCVLPSPGSDQVCNLVHERILGATKKVPINQEALDQYASPHNR